MCPKFVVSGHCSVMDGPPDRESGGVSCEAIQSQKLYFLSAMWAFANLHHCVESICIEVVEPFVVSLLLNLSIVSAQEPLTGIASQSHKTGVINRSPMYQKRMVLNVYSGKRIAPPSSLQSIV